MRRLAVAGVVLLAACSGGQAPLGHLDLPDGYATVPVGQREPAAFRRQYRDDAGATAVALHRVETPGGDGLVVVALAWPRRMDDHLAALAHRLERDVPLRGSEDSTVAGHPARVHDADDTFQSTVLAVDGHRGVLVYGGRLADERVVAAAVLRGW